MSRLYILCGLPFAGKSTLARELARQRDCQTVDIDQINAARGVGIAGAPIAAEEWAASFAEAYRQLRDALGSGQSVAYDGHAFARQERARLRAVADHYGVPTIVIFVATPERIARERLLLNRRDPRRHDVPDDRFARAVALLEVPDDDESPLRYDGSAPAAAWVARLPRSSAHERGGLMDNASEGPVLTITGDTVALGPIRRDLIPTYARWVNDLGAVRNTGMPPLPMTIEREEAWYDRAVKSDDTYTFTIYTRDGLTPIGTTSVMGIDWRNRTAEFGILIGEATTRGKGYGTETARLILDYAFTALGLHSIYLRVHEYNLAGRRAYEKAGYREFGRRRQSIQMGGRRWDTIYMDCLASDFTSTNLVAIFSPDLPR